jgi:predicted amidohydrolase YtcJ
MACPYNRKNMKLLYNANIHTLDSSNPKANAILIARERILAVGEKDEIALTGE